MLGILLLILKIIGIILLAILGLIVLLVLTVLFVPIKYRVSARYYDKKPYVNVRVTWLLKLFRFKAEYADEFVADAKVLMFTLFSTENEKESDLETGEPKTVLNTQPPNSDIEPEEPLEHKQLEQSEQKEQPEVKEQPKIKQTQTEEHKRKSKIKAFFEDLKEKKDAAVNKVKDIKKMVDDENNKEAVKFVWGRFKNLIRHIRPKRFDLYVHYGFENIETTGKVTMYAAILYGFIGNPRIKLLPDFENNIIEGEAYIKGHIRLIWVVINGLKVYTNKQVKRLIKKVF